MKKVGLYIHIPFCERKCHYCDFTSVPENNVLIGEYVTYLKRELDMISRSNKDISLDTIFIGGGTPSVLPEAAIRDLLVHLSEIFNMEEEAEITIEINPGTISREKAMVYRGSGINRVSMGIQAMSDNALEIIGRIHNKDQVVETVKILKEAGFQNINGDVIFGLPHQSVKDFEDTMERVLDLELTHISMYGLILEEGTLLNKWHRRGLVSMPSEDDEREMYHRGIELLGSRGYDQYEISNFAKDGYQCRHNIRYWKLGDYFGAGLASHSFVHGQRYWNHSSFRKYFQGIDEGKLPIEEREEINGETRKAEYLMLGIRLSEGISLNDYHERFGSSLLEDYMETISKHRDAGLIELVGGHLRLTNKGLDLSNQVEVDFLP